MSARRYSQGAVVCCPTQQILRRASACCAWMGLLILASVTSLKAEICPVPEPTVVENEISACIKNYGLRCKNRCDGSAKACKAQSEFCAQRLTNQSTNIRSCYSEHEGRDAEISKCLWAVSDYWCGTSYQGDYSNCLIDHTGEDGRDSEKTKRQEEISSHVSILMNDISEISKISSEYFSESEEKLELEMYDKPIIPFFEEELEKIFSTTQRILAEQSSLNLTSLQDLKVRTDVTRWITQLQKAVTEQTRHIRRLRRWQMEVKEHASFKENMQALHKIQADLHSLEEGLDKLKKNRQTSEEHWGVALALCQSVRKKLNGIEIKLDTESQLKNKLLELSDRLCETASLCKEHHQQCSG